TAGAGQRTSSRSSARNSDSRNAQLGCFGVEVCQLPEEEARPCDRCTDPAMDFSNVAADEFNDWYDAEHIPERPARARLPDASALDRRRQSPTVSRNLRSRQPRGAAKPRLPRDRRREPVTVVEAGDLEGGT